MDDWELLEAWRGGDERAGEILLGRYLGLLARFFKNKVRDDDDASELVSDTMLACARSKQSIREGRAFRPFVFGTAMNVLSNYYRIKAKRRRELGDFQEVCAAARFGHSPSMSSLLSLARQSNLLVQALRSLSLDQQIVLELRYFEELGGSQIAELLELPAQTVYSRLRRGKERLNEVMVALARSPQLAESTMTGIETWAAMIREEISS
ncbi:MAG: sigma-70 family RNA polymerase sigma factor [Nannocystaceae bacterium]